MEEEAWEKDCVREAINIVCKSKKQDGQYTCRITLWSVLVTILPWKDNEY